MRDAAHCVLERSRSSLPATLPPARACGLSISLKDNLRPRLDRAPCTHGRLRTAGITTGVATKRRFPNPVTARDHKTMHAQHHRATTGPLCGLSGGMRFPPAAIRSCTPVLQEHKALSTHALCSRHTALIVTLPIVITASRSAGMPGDALPVLRSVSSCSPPTPPPPFAIPPYPPYPPWLILLNLSPPSCSILSVSSVPSVVNLP